MDFSNIPFDDIMKNLKYMPDIVKQKQKEMAEIKETGYSGYEGMSISVTINGLYDIVGTTIDPDVLKQTPDIVADLFISASHSAKRKIDERNKSIFGNSIAGFPGSNT